MSLGFQLAGFDVSSAFDSNVIDVAMHQANFPTCRSMEVDLRAVDGRDIRALAGIGHRSTIDVVFGGPPCQGFSYGGKRNIADPRNHLLVRFGALVASLRPRYFVMENVPGLLANKARPFLHQCLDQVTSAGYEVVEPLTVLDAFAFGVPQRRRRLFVLGCQAGERPPVYPTSAAPQASVRDAIEDLTDIHRRRELVVNDRYLGRTPPPRRYARALGRDSDGADGATTGLGGCGVTAHSEEVLIRFAALRPGEQDPVSRFHRLDWDGIAPTLRAGAGSFTAPRPVHPEHPRCITAREAARLHSLPDWFELNHAKWHAFRQVGNSVPPMLARAVACEVAKAAAKG